MHQNRADVGSTYPTQVRIVANPLRFSIWSHERCYWQSKPRKPLGLSFSLVSVCDRVHTARPRAGRKEAENFAQAEGGPDACPR